VGVLSTSELFPGHAQLGGALLVGQKKKRWYLSIKGPGQTGHPGGGTDGPGHRPYLIMHAAVCQKRLLRRRGCLGGWCQVPPPHRARRSARGRHRGAVAGGRHSTTPSSSGEEQRRCCMRTGRRPIGRGQRSTATRIGVGVGRTTTPGRRLLHRELPHVVHCTASRLHPHPRPNPLLKTCEISPIRSPHHKIMRSWGTEHARGREVGSGAHQPPLLGAVCRCVRRDARLGRAPRTRPCRARASPHHMGHAPRGGFAISKAAAAAAIMDIYGLGPWPRPMNPRTHMIAICKCKCKWEMASVREGCARPFRCWRGTQIYDSTCEFRVFKS
jgi:hypothetical protein